MDDWTPIEVKSPPAGVPLIVTVRRDVSEGPRLVVLDNVYYMKVRGNPDFGFYGAADENNQIGPSYFKVTAWMEYPEPYEEASYEYPF